MAVGNISGLPKKHKFHFTDIPEMWLKVDVREILQKGVALMFPFDADDQNVINDVRGTSTLWDQKYLKMTITSRKWGFYDYVYNCVCSRTGHLRLLQ